MQDLNPDVLSIQGHELESGQPDIDLGEMPGLERLLTALDNFNSDRVYQGRRCSVVKRFGSIVVGKFSDGLMPFRRVFINGAFDFLPVWEER